jgi:ubiquitin-like protein 4
MTLTIPAIQPGATTVQSVKEQVQSYLGGPGVVASTEKVKLLLHKKPIPASKKTVAEALEGSDVAAGSAEVELGVMVMGGAPDPPPQVLPEPVSLDPGVAQPTAEKGLETTPMEGVEDTKTQPVQPGELSGRAVLDTDEFWADLQGFMEQRIRSSEEAVRLRGVFEKAWRSSTSAP